MKIFFILLLAMVFVGCSDQSSSVLEKVQETTVGAMDSAKDTAIEAVDSAKEAVNIEAPIAEDVPEVAPEDTNMDTFKSVLGFSVEDVEDVNEEATEEKTYTVVQGDTLGSIAKQHDTSVTALAEANAIINPNLIYPGDVLSIE